MFSVLGCNVLGSLQLNGADDVAPSGVALLIPAILGVVVLAITVVTFWKLFTKAGEPGWASVVPVYNLIVLMKIIGKPWWYLFVPVLNLIAVAFFVPFGLARKFGKGAGFGAALLFFPYICYPILGFGSAQYNANA
jgi:hypothetical protein